MGLVERAPPWPATRVLVAGDRAPAIGMCSPPARPARRLSVTRWDYE